MCRSISTTEVKKNTKLPIGRRAYDVLSYQSGLLKSALNLSRLPKQNLTMPTNLIVNGRNGFSQATEWRHECIWKYGIASETMCRTTRRHHERLRKGLHVYFSDQLNTEFRNRHCSPPNQPKKSSKPWYKKENTLLYMPRTCAYIHYRRHECGQMPSRVKTS